jgi:hypothetical protein
MRKEHEGDYLWDRSGEPDSEVVRLERALGTLRSQARPPVFPMREPAPTRRLPRLLVSLVAAAVVTLVAGAAWFAWGQRRVGWAVQAVAGTPLIDGRVLTGDSRLRLGKWLETGAGSKARVAVGQIGRLDVDPHTRVQLVESRGREHRIALEQGTIHARIWAPPRFFFVNTPSAVAIDLGCAYTLHIDETGAGEVRVTHGWVGFEYKGRESFIPERAVCATRPGFGPGTPRYEDAPDGFDEALATLDFGAPDEPRRRAALDLVLARARQRDALTLWHLLTRGSAEERRRVFDRMAVLAPPPAGVTREAVLSGNRGAIDSWWNTLGLESTTWWRIWKKSW